LARVGVLIFVDQQVIETVGLGLADFRVLLQEVFGD
jgi:hypothetical protein